MGLDMYLQGEKFFAGSEEERPHEDGFEVSAHSLQLAYWRKHPDLHGYIIREFAGGVDDCKEIDLIADDCRKIAAAIIAKKLPHTEGFFFGDSEYHEGNEEADAQLFQNAASWVENMKDVKGVWASLSYRASW